MHPMRPMNPMRPFETYVPHASMQVGCLRKAGVQGLNALPEGDWFCNDECAHCYAALAAQVCVPGLIG